MTVGKGRLFRLSVDPAHPLPVAATLDPPPRGKPVPEGGVVDFANGMTIFYCGDGGLRFSSGKLRPDRSVTHPYLNPRAGLDAELVRTRVMIQRIAYPGEKERLGLSPDQLRRINTLREAPVPVDAERFAGLFDAWDRAADGPAKATAAAPLFAGAKDVGTQDTASRQGYVDGFRAVVTPRQWKLLNYEIPTPADK
jgi:hypothetical protein